ncbi:MAG: 3-hydroxyacyl-CoA dehydrogenase NAD-binding domain-containing protein [Candidatus Hermodarchaeota archaeon]
MVDIGKIKNIAVIGAGVQGHSITQICLMAGFDKVFLNDINQEAIERGIRWMIDNPETGLKKLESEGKLGEETTVKHLLNNLFKEVNLKKVAENADFVIEAVPEVMTIKKEVYKNLGEYTRKDTVLASNTSTMSISKLGEASGKPEKVIGMHFFSPIGNKLIEITKGNRTSDESVQIGIAIGEKLPSTEGKRVIINLEKETPGHIANRIIGSINPYLNWVFDQAISKDIPFEQIDADIIEFMPNGICKMCDGIGIDTVYNAMKYFEETLSPEFAPSKVLERLVNEGNLGLKTGKGFYDWTDGKSPEINPSNKAGIVEIEVLLAQFLNEGCRLLEQGVVKGYKTIDKVISAGYRIPGPFSMNKRNYERLSQKLEETAKITGKLYLRPCNLMKSGEFLKMRK